MKNIIKYTICLPVMFFITLALITTYIIFVILGIMGEIIDFCYDGHFEYNTKEVAFLKDKLIGLWKPLK